MTLYEFSSKLAIVSSAISGLGFVTGLIIYKRIGPMFRWLSFYMGLMIFLDLLSYLLGYVFFKNNLIVLHIYGFTELLFLLLFYKKFLFQKKQKFLTTLSCFGLAYILAETMLIFVFKELDVKQFQSYAKVVDNFIIILMALAYLHERMNQFREKEWGSFRLNIVFLVFFTLTTLFFLPFNFMVNASYIKFYFWTGHIIMLLSFYLYLSFEIINNGLKNKIKRTKSNI